MEFYLPLLFDNSHGAPPKLLGPALLWFCTMGRDPRNVKNLTEGYEPLSAAERAAMFALQSEGDTWTFDNAISAPSLAAGYTACDGVWWGTEDEYQIWMGWTTKAQTPDAMPFMRFRVYGPPILVPATPKRVEHYRYEPCFAVGKSRAVDGLISYPGTPIDPQWFSMALKGLVEPETIEPALKKEKIK